VRVSVSKAAGRVNNKSGLGIKERGERNGEILGQGPGVCMFSSLLLSSFSRFILHEPTHTRHG